MQFKKKNEMKIKIRIWRFVFAIVLVFVGEDDYINQKIEV